MHEEIIQIKNLDAYFGEKQVLKNISLSCKKNQITLIIGGSGSGKTTLLKHLLGLYQSESGIVKVFNNDLNSMDEESMQLYYKTIGVLYQNGALLNSIPVGENIALPLEQHTTLTPQLIEEMVYAKLGLVNMEETYNLFPSELSGGMLKRAALARAIIMDPLLLFCDEPGAGLDPVSLASLDNLIIDLKNKLGISVFMVTHELSSIQRLADHIVFLHQGEVVFEGSLNMALQSKNEQVYKFFHQKEVNGS
jgi:phospholipid/cholesterol/gamma-HCH transport system ATP-binding protein